MAQNIKVPFKVIGGLRAEDTPTHKVIREALANCLIHADYYGRRGLVVKYKPHEITLENPGRFRIDIAAAIEGTITDPRNSLLMKFFNLINVGERSGRGIYEIYRVWTEMKWNTPTLIEMLEADRTKLTLPLKKVTIKNDDKKDTQKTTAQKELILSYIEEHGEITTREAAELLLVGLSRSKALLHQLTDGGKITPQGDNKNRIYCLARTENVRIVKRANR